MVEEAKKEEVKVSEEKGKEVIPQKVELDSEQYTALLDRLAELEAAATQPRRGKEEEVTNLETLAEEGKRGKRGKVKEEEEEELPNLDEMSNTQLTKFLLNNLNKTSGERLEKIEVAVETLRIMREIDKAEVKHDDFWKYEEKIRGLAIENPGLSIEKAYKLAKVEAGEETARKKGKEGEEEQAPAKTRTEKMLKLPPRTFGEKPGPAASSTKESSGKVNLRKAAEKAWNDVVGEGKTQI